MRRKKMLFGILASLTATVAVVPLPPAIAKSKGKKHRLCSLNSKVKGGRYEPGTYGGTAKEMGK